MTTIDLNKLALLHRFCRQNQLCHHINFGEASDLWDIEVIGAGRGEEFIAKNVGTLGQAVDYVLQDGLAFYASLGHPQELSVEDVEALPDRLTMIQLYTVVFLAAVGDVGHLRWECLHPADTVGLNWFPLPDRIIATRLELSIFDDELTVREHASRSAGMALAQWNKCLQLDPNLGKPA